MKYLKLALVAAVAAAALSGCYYDPDYSYVRGTPGYNGSAYYGRSAAGYDDGYYGYYGAPAYYGGGYYGCCYAPGVSVGVSSVWYGGARYRDDGRRYRREDDHSRRGHDNVHDGDHRDRGHRRHDHDHDRR